MKKNVILLFILIIFSFFAFNLLVNADEIKKVDISDHFKDKIKEFVDQNGIKLGDSEETEKIEKESNNLRYLKCGDAKDIPEIVPQLTSYAVTLLKTAVPIVLIIMSVIQLVKAITAGKEDEIKKAQSSLIKKVIIAALVFFIVSIVQFVMLKVADSSEKDNLSSCLSCFLNGTSDCGGIYTKDGYGSCIYVDTNDSFECDK